MPSEIIIPGKEEPNRGGDPPSMGLKGVAGTIANMSVVAVMCVLLWFQFAKWMPEMAAAHREDLRLDRAAARDDLRAFREGQQAQSAALTAALAENTRAIYALKQELAAVIKAKD